MLIGSGHPAKHRNDETFRQSFLVCPDRGSCPFRLPGGYVGSGAFPMRQMLSRRELGGSPPHLSYSAPTVEDLPGTVELASVAKPGPLGGRSPMLGTWIGIREHGRLLATAGECLRLPGSVALSAMYSHPDARRRGFGSLLTRSLTAVARRRAAIPFLHVRCADRADVSRCRRLGYGLRRAIAVLWRKPSRRPA
jgi:GNAT superfamily N-acetyltransferase